MRIVLGVVCNGKNVTLKGCRDLGVGDLKSLQCIHMMHNLSYFCFYII